MRDNHSIPKREESIQETINHHTTEQENTKYEID